MCLVLSLLWHFVGALAIGILPEPQASYAQALPPTLSLALPMEVLHVGMDAQGVAITRPILNDHDPEYFGFPRTWAFGRLQSAPSPSQHAPWIPEEIQAPALSKLYAEPAAEKGNHLLEDPIPWEIVPTGALAEDILELSRRTESRQWPCVAWHLGKASDLTLVLRGPLAQRKCLVQIQPSFDQNSLGKSRTLFLANGSAPIGAAGLSIRLWVNNAGNVQLACLENSSGDPQVDGVALRAVRQWQFISIMGPGDALQWGSVLLENVTKP